MYGLIGLFVRYAIANKKKTLVTFLPLKS